MNEEKNLSQQEIDNLVNLYQKGSYIEAQSEATSLTERFPNYPFGWRILGAILRKRGLLSQSLIAKKKVAVKSIKLNNLLKCGEIFITNSIFGIRPVAKVLNKKIGNKIEKIEKIEQFLSKLGL